MKTEDLIVQLARSAQPVQPLPPPSVRVVRWTIGAVSIAVLATILVGPRADLAAAVQQPAFIGVALAILLTTFLSAAAALVSSVPGAERSAASRVLPFAAAAGWALLLVVLLAASDDPGARLHARLVHWACIVEIGAIGFIPAWSLFVMLRRAAPLRFAWSAALATLAAAALGAAATQFICPIDNPAHHLVGHWLPAVLFVALGALAGRSTLDWIGRPGSPSSGV